MHARMTAMFAFRSNFEILRIKRCNKCDNYFLRHNFTHRYVELFQENLFRFIFPFISDFKLMELLELIRFAVCLRKINRSLALGMCCNAIFYGMVSVIRIMFTFMYGHSFVFLSLSFFLPRSSVNNADEMIIWRQMRETNLLSYYILCNMLAVYHLYIEIGICWVRRWNNSHEICTDCRIYLCTMS